MSFSLSEDMNFLIKKILAARSAANILKSITDQDKRGPVVGMIELAFYFWSDALPSDFHASTFFVSAFAIAADEVNLGLL